MCMIILDKTGVSTTFFIVLFWLSYQQLSYTVALIYDWTQELYYYLHAAMNEVTH